MLRHNYFGLIVSPTWLAARGVALAATQESQPSNNFKHGSLKATSAKVNVLENPRVAEEP